MEDTIKSLKIKILKEILKESAKIVNRKRKKERIKSCPDSYSKAKET
jgi:hypothetical protein